MMLEATEQIRLEEHGAASASRGLLIKKKKVEQDEAEVAVHSQVRKIKQEDEKARELLMRLQLLETRPATTTGGFREPPAARQASPSPLQRAGGVISIGGR